MLPSTQTPTHPAKRKDFWKLTSHRRKHKLKCFCLVYFSGFPCQMWHIRIFTPSQYSYPKILQRLSGSIHGCYCAQVWSQNDFSPSICQSRCSYHTRASLAHSRLQTLFNAATSSLRRRRHTSCTVHGIIWQLLCHGVVCCYRKAAAENVSCIFISFPTQPVER